MAQGDTKADGKTITGGSNLSICPAQNEHWSLKATFADEPDDVEFVICARNGAVKTNVEIIGDSTNSVPINNGTYFELKNNSCASRSMSYHAVQHK